MPGAGAEKVVVVNDLVKKFGAFAAVDRVSFDVTRGEIFGFLGPNGAGKTTAIRILCGLLAPTSGGGSVAGYDISSQQERIKQHIGYMSQKFSLYEDLTVEENIDFYSGIYRIPADKKRERKEWVIHMAGLEKRRGTLAGVLAGGWKQKLALGCAVLHEPPVIFLDEPTSGVDPVSRRGFWELIHELAGRGVTVFVTTHYMDEAEYCDRLGLMYRGELIALGTPAELKNKYMTDHVLDIQCARPQDMIDDIEKLEGIKEAALFGRGLHIVSADADAAEREVRAAFEGRGLPAPAIERIAPSLEDVFVSLIEARDRASHPIAEVAK